MVVGIIDDGIAFANERFRRADGTTRVEYAWLQDGAHDRGPPPDFEFGLDLIRLAGRRQ